MVGGHLERANGRGITQPAICHHPRRAAHHQTGDEDIPSTRGTRILTAVHHQHMALGACLNRDALRVFGIAKLDQLIAVFAGGHIAQRERRADHILPLCRDRADPLHHLIAQPAFIQRRGQRRD